MRSRAEPSAGFLKWVLGSNDSEMRQTWNEQWNISDPFQLPRYVSPRTYEWIRHRFPLNPDAFNHDASGRFALIRTMYETLCRHGIRYRLEKSFHERGIAQGIRDPREILEHPREGTCLDLTLLFCGLCISARLVPWIVIAEGHAFAAISLVHGWDDWDIDREEWDDFFYQGSGRLKLLEDRQKLIHYLSMTRGRYLVLECTGFADARGVFDGSDAPEALGRNADGLITFEIALEVGQKQISCMSRELLFAIDVMIAQRNCGLAPFEIPVPSQACVRERPSLNLEYLIDRIPQRTDIEQQLISAHARGSGRPSLFLVVGDPDQGHRALIKRLENHDLPDFLDRLYPYANALLVRSSNFRPQGQRTSTS